MGGNVKIGNVLADRIDLLKVNRDQIVHKLSKTLMRVNLSFRKLSGTPLWEDELFKSNAFLSGSSIHLFNKAITTPEFISCKKTVGDIDVQVDREQRDSIKKFLDANEGKKFGYGALVGYKSSGDQFITLWGFEEQSLNIQIDIELVDFAKGKPTPWSQFSHSSSWEDTKEGIKGVFQKYLMRAFTSKSLRDVVILKGKKQVPTITKTTDLAFSVTRGLREKLKPVVDENGKQRMMNGLFVFEEIPVKESTYVNDIQDMFVILFGVSPTKSDLKDFESFMGGLRLVNKYFTNVERRTLVLGFANTLFGSGAQGLYRGDPVRDYEEKNIAMDKMINTLRVNINCDTIEKMRLEYYKNYK